MLKKGLRAFLLTGTAVIAVTVSAQAASKTDKDAKLDALQQEVQDLDAQIQQLKQQAAAPAATSDIAPQLEDLKRSTSAQYTDVTNQLNALPKASVDNGRLSITSADGRFSAAVRGLLQFDSGYYSQGHGAAAPGVTGPDFGSGSNFRRVYLGLSGKVFGDWSYNLNFDFGGSGGTETPGHIQSVYLQYDGLAPWALRVGAFPPPTSVEDATSAGDTIFLERNSPSDLQRNIAGGDGRDAVTLLYAAPTLFGALSYTGNKIGDGAKALAAAGATAAPNFDEQEAVVGRLSYLPISTPDAHWLIGVNGTYVIKPPDAIANGTAANSTNTPGGAVKSSISLSDPPELTIDSNGYTLASTGALPANHITQWGVETAGNWENIYAQAGYYGFELDRAPAAYTQFTASGVSGMTIVQPNNDNFSAWYVQATWLLTGESRPYNQATGSFTSPKPAHPFSLDGSGWGALEFAARYSDLNLNDHVNDPSTVVTAWSGATKTYTYYNTVRGGDQRIITLGLNWYPNSVVRFGLNYELIQASRLQAPGTVATAGVPVIPALNGGQNLQAIALRAQLSL